MIWGRAMMPALDTRIEDMEKSYDICIRCTRTEDMGKGYDAYTYHIIFRLYSS
jgi:hypothetical protein